MEIELPEPKSKRSDKEEPEEAPHLSNFAKFYFFSMGIGGLLSWNTILTAIDYFQVSFPSHNISFLFPIPSMIGAFSITLFMVEISQRISLNVRIIFGISGSCLIMILMVISTALLPEKIGFIALMILLLVRAATNIISEASLVGISGLFPATYIRYFQAGIGCAGLCVNVFRMISLATVGEDSSDLRSITVYFGLVFVVTVHCIVMHLKFSQTYTFKYYIMKAATSKQTGESTDNLPSDPSEPASEKKTGKTNFLNEANSVKLCQILKETLPHVLLMILILTQTFMMFPGVTLKKQLSGLNSAWNTVVLITLYNIFDVIGKSLAGIKRTVMKKYLIWVVLLRFFLYLPFILIAMKQKGWIQEDWVDLLVVAIFGLSNGYCASSLYVIAPEEAENHKKESVGFVIQLSLYIGIALGTLLALPFRNLGSTK